MQSWSEAAPAARRPTTLCGSESDAPPHKVVDEHGKADLRVHDGPTPQRLQAVDLDPHCRQTASSFNATLRIQAVHRQLAQAEQAARGVLVEGHRHHHQWKTCTASSVPQQLPVQVLVVIR